VLDCFVDVYHHSVNTPKCFEHHLGCWSVGCPFRVSFVYFSRFAHFIPLFLKFRHPSLFSKTSPNSMILLTIIEFWTISHSVKIFYVDLY
jgi:hypothetical protein